MQNPSRFLQFRGLPCHTLPWSAIRAGQVYFKALLHVIITLINLPPLSHLPLQDSNHQLLEKRPPYPCHPIQTCNKHISSPAGQIPHMIIACATHPGWRAWARACIRHTKLLPLEVRPPPGKGPETVFYMASLINHQ